MWRNHQYLLAADRGTETLVEEDVIVLSQLFGNQVWHFVSENLARLAYILGDPSSKWDLTRAKFHLAADGVKNFAFAHRLELLQLVTGNPAVKVVTGKVFARRVIYPPNVHCLLPSLRVHPWLRDHLRCRYQEIASTRPLVAMQSVSTQSQPSTLCLVSRPKKYESPRAIADVEGVARDLGIRVIKATGTGTVQSQASCYFNSDAVAGTHGGGEVFTLFLRRLGTLVEIFPSARFGSKPEELFYLHHCYMYLAVVLELHYYGLAWPRPDGVNQLSRILRERLGTNVPRETLNHVRPSGRNSSSWSWHWPW